MPEKNATILVVEDDDDVRRAICAWLATAEYTSLEAADGQQGLALIQTARPDAVLLDLRLPLLDGFGVLAALPRGNGAPPVIIISGQDEIEGVVRAFRLGAADYLQKPILSFDLLGHALAAVLERETLTRAVRLAETRYFNLVQNLPLMVFVLDADLNLTFVNKFCRTLLGFSRADAQTMLVPASSGGLTDVPVDAGQHHIPCLTEEKARQLATWGLALERHFGRPQDMEWAEDADGHLVILQARPLTAMADAESQATPPVPGAEILAEGGQAACSGVGCGPVYNVLDDATLDAFPQGAVLVAAHSSPQFMVAMQRTAAIVTNHGSVTGHMASLSREFGVPTLLGLGNATERLTPGEIVTVDATSGRVYRGRVDSLLRDAGPTPAFMAGTQVHAILDEAARRIVPLGLLDPKAPGFRPEGCQTLHDVTRLLHEWSYGEMFAVSDLVAGGRGATVILHATTGLDLHIIDLGGGIKDAAAGQTRVAPEDIASRPFAALLTGLVLTEKAKALRPVNLGGFLSVMSEQLIAQPKAGADRFGEKSYAIISDKYLNFSSRVGYHYGVLDCYCGQTVNKNYITFSFSGGAADDVKRSRRARAIGRILTELGFTVDTVSDRVSGRFQKFAAPVIEEKLGHMGRLLQFTRQTDMLMVSEKSIDAMVTCFLSGAPCFDPATWGVPPDNDETT